MAVRGVYTELEKEMLDDLENTADKLAGWSKIVNPVAKAESIKSFGYNADPWNPIWRDENYARNTRWGNIIAFPSYEYHFGGFMWSPKAPADGSFVYESYVGEDWEFFKVIRPGDSIRVWNRRPRIEDITSLDGKGLRKFAAFPRDTDYINQKDELISTLKLYLEQTIFPACPEPYAMPEYGYTKEELKYLDRLAREEEIRGDNIRYWEDVSVGDMLRPTVLGPTSTGGGAGMSMSDRPIPPREVLRDSEMSQGREDFLPGPDGLFYTHSGRHASDRSAQAEGEPRGWLFGAASKMAMTRCVTNWMGNDGFIKKLRWRHIARIAIGDAIIDTGRVTDKRIENDEHVVDILIWGRDMRGNIVQAATFTVSLLSKEASNPFKWK